MRDIFGNNALIGSLELFIVAIFVLGAMIFRKSVANDMLDRGFSVIGASVGGVLSFLILNGIFDKLKLSIGVGVACWVIAGFLLEELIGDGEAS